MTDKYPTWRINVTLCLNGIVSIEIQPSETFERNHVTGCNLTNGVDVRSSLLSVVQDACSALPLAIEAAEYAARHHASQKDLVTGP